jgi:hypothetical protein
MRIRHVPYRSFGPYSRYRGLAGFSFGTASQWQNKECPLTPSNWDDWCNCVFPAGSDLNNRCKSKPFPVGFVTPPWTEVGAGARGLPKPGSLVASLTTAGVQIVSNITGGAVQGPPQPPLTLTLPPVQGGTGASTNASSTSTPTSASEPEPSIFGVPRTIAYVGGGVLVLGVLALALGK